MKHDREILATIEKVVGADIPAVKEIDKSTGYVSNGESLTGLSLSNVGIEVLPPEIGQFEDLQALSLHGNELTSLPRAIFSLKRLKMLDLSGNELRSLPLEIVRLQALKTLKLSSNPLTSLPPEIVRLQGLQTLSLNNNNLMSLPPEIVQLLGLKKLALASNRLTSLPPEIIRLRGLQILDLSFNKLTLLPSYIGQLRELQELELHVNDLTSLPPAIGQLQELRALGLHGNKLTSLPPEIGQLQELGTLGLNRNKLVSLPSEICRLQGLEWLDLSENELTSLPSEIGRLQELRILDLSKNKLASLPLEIFQLQGLKILHLNDNKLTSLPPDIGQLQGLRTLGLGSNQLTSLPAEIERLKELQKLDLNNNQLASLPPKVEWLKGLQELDLSNTGLTFLPSDLGQLNGLQLLKLSHNHLTSLPPWIYQLQGLKTLALSNTGLMSLSPEVGQLHGLERLDLSANSLTSLPPEIGQLQELKTLDLRNNDLESLPSEILNLDLDFNKWEIIIGVNPLQDPPLEICHQGRKAIASYFKSQKEIRLLNEVKVLLVGNGEAGKTSLVKRLRGESFDPNEPQTDGINIADWTFLQNEREIVARFWDFGGQEIMHSTHQFFLSKRSVYILVLDVRRDDNTEYWLKTIESFGGNSPILVVLNKIDQNPNFEVDRRQLQKKYPGIVGFHRISCKKEDAENQDGIGIAELREAIQASFDKVEILQTKWPKRWFELKTRLENMSRPFINYQDYGEMCDRDRVRPKDRQILVRFLADLGVVVHFADYALQDVYVLDPSWTTNGVYTIINSEHLAETQGILDLRHLPDLLDPDTYPRERHQYLVALMKKFELCYELEGSRVLIPDLLRQTTPAFDLQDESPLRFVIDYRYYLPRSIMPRLIVKLHSDIDGELRWRKGIVLKNCRFCCSASVICDYDRRDIRITISGERRREYLQIIRYFLDEIHVKFEELEFIERVPLPDAKGAADVSYEHLRFLEEKGQETYIPEGARKEYQVRSLLGYVQERENPKRQMEDLIEEIHDKVTEEKKGAILSLVGLKVGWGGITPSFDFLEAYRQLREWNDRRQRNSDQRSD